MRILVTFAVEAEFSPWRKLRKFEKTKPFLNSFSSRTADSEVTVLLTGMGCKGPWVEAMDVIWNRGVDICISTGLAGALRPKHGIRAILVPTNVMGSKSDQSVSGDSVLIGAAVAAGATRVATFYTADHIVVQTDEKQRLGVLADAVEMESAEILAEAASRGARVVAVRAISDTSGEVLPLDFNKVATEKGTVSISKIVGKAMISPSSIPSLIRFGQQSKQATVALAEFLERFVPSLVVSPAVPQQGVAR